MQGSSGLRLRDSIDVTLGGGQVLRKLSELTPSERSLLDVLPDAIVFVDETGVIREVNQGFLTMSGYFFEEILGQPVEVLVPSRHRERHVGDRRGFLLHPTSRPMAISRDLELLCKDGHEVAVDISLSPLNVRGEVWTVAVVRDNSFKRAAENARIEAERHALAVQTAAAQALEASEQRFRLAFEDNMAPMVFSDLNDLAIDANDAFCQMVGFTKDELLGHNSQQFTLPGDVGITETTHLRLTSGEVDQVRYIKRYLRRDGRVIVAEVSRSAARDPSGKILYFVSSERDITEQQELTDQLSHQALHDSLTGLANRALFEDRLSQAHARIGRHGGFGAVMLLDLDDFKGVNDTYGHLFGDQLLKEVARRLESVTRSSDTLCRLGGDEFLYLAEGLTSMSEADEVANRLLRAISEPFQFHGLTLDQHASIGVVVCDGQGSSEIQCIQDADVALYEAKSLRRGHYVTFTPSMHQMAVNNFSLAQALRQAFNAGHLSMHYQPIFDLVSNEITGFEALMRWHDPERGWIPPDAFIPLAERSGLILELGSFAMREALTTAKSWDRPGNESAGPYVTVNLSANQFHDPGLLSMVETALSDSGLAPGRLIIEITESVALLNASETMNTMSQLRNSGVGVAMDDFGTGYSSLSYIALLNPSIIKIDQSFVSPAQESDQNNTLLEAIVALGLKLNKIVLAEGIETKEQLGRLRLLGCHLGQGFFFSPAVPASEATTLLNKTNGSWTKEDWHG